MSTETFERHEDKEFATGLFDFTEDLNTFVKALFLPCLVSLPFLLVWMYHIRILFDKLWCPCNIFISYTFNPIN